MLLNDMVDYLSSQGGWTGGTNLFAGRRPPAPPTCGSLFEIPGLAPVGGMRAAAGESAVELPGLQVVWRSTDYTVARVEAHRAWKLLDGMPDRLVNGVRYKWSACRQSPFGLGTEGDDLALIGFNVDLVKVVSTTS